MIDAARVQILAVNPNLTFTEIVPLAYAGAIATLAAAALLLACALPLRRALHFDPVVLFKA